MFGEGVRLLALNMPEEASVYFAAAHKLSPGSALLTVQLATQYMGVPWRPKEARRLLNGIAKAKTTTAPMAKVARQRLSQLKKYEAEHTREAERMAVELAPPELGDLAPTQRAVYDELLTRMGEAGGRAADAASPGLVGPGW